MPRRLACGIPYQHPLIHLSCLASSETYPIGAEAPSTQNTLSTAALESGERLQNWFVHGSYMELYYHTTVHMSLTPNISKFYFGTFTTAHSDQAEIEQRQESGFRYLSECISMREGNCRMLYAQVLAAICHISIALSR